MSLCVVSLRSRHGDNTWERWMRELPVRVFLPVQGESSAPPRFQVIACIAVRSFGVRKEDMRKHIEATRGKVFTPKALDRMVEGSELAGFAITD